ncbi:MAG: type II secretion system protein [Planctomycetota bacterium]
MARPNGACARRAFTLIELLIVTAIIAMLIGILLPALGAARGSARELVCLSAMRSLGSATHAYADENRESWPQSSHTAGWTGTPWPYALASYFSEFRTDRGGVDTRGWRAYIERYLRCPEDPRRLAPRDETRAEYNGSYAFNVYFELTPEELGGRFDAIGAKRDWSRRDRAMRPSSTVHAGETVPSDAELSRAMPADDHFMAHLFPTDPDELSAIAADRHAGRSSYLWLDGHAQAEPLERVFLLDANGRVERDLWNPATAH